MANFLTNWMSGIMDSMAQRVATYVNDRMSMGYKILGNYYSGDHRPQLKRVEGKQDDNVIQNFVGLAVDRSVSRLFRGGVKFVLPNPEPETVTDAVSGKVIRNPNRAATEQQEYIDKVWDINKKGIILYQVGLHGAVYGTTYFKINPNDIRDPLTGDMYPALVAIDPEMIRVFTHPQNMNKVEKYLIEYKCPEERGGRTVEVLHREITKHAMSAPEEVSSGIYSQSEEMETWVIETYEQVGGGPIQLVEAIEWPYDFPPILHWKNLPSLKSCYGDSEIDDTINIQDRQSFATSNIGKIIKYHAAPNTIGTGFSADQVKQVDNAPNVFHAIPNPDAKVFNLEMQSDLTSSRNFANDLRQSIFDIAREVDTQNIKDNAGALTNLGLRLIFGDALDKNDTKRQLYGDALMELNRRLLVLAGWQGLDSDPGSIVWGEPLPVNIVEEMTADKLALEMGIVDRETVGKRYTPRYGVEWGQIEENLNNQATRDNENNANIGDLILRQFEQGGGTGLENARPLERSQMTGV